MFDNDASGTIDVYEFEKLYNYINQWLVRSNKILKKNKYAMG